MNVLNEKRRSSLYKPLSVLYVVLDVEEQSDNVGVGVYTSDSERSVGFSVRVVLSVKTAPL